MKHCKDRYTNLQKGLAHAGSILSDAAEWIVAVLYCGILSYLTVLVFAYSFNTENSVPIKSNLLLQIALFITIAGSWYLLRRFLSPHIRLCKWLSITLFLLTLLLVGVSVWTYVSQTLIYPNSDPKACFDIALRFYQSEFGAVVPEGSYLSLWPFQTGFIFILEKTMRLFHTTDYLLFQRINVFYILMLIACGYRIVCLLTKEIANRILYLLLMAAYYQLLFRVTEIYGDLPGLAWMTFSGMCFLLMCRKNGKIKKIIFAFLFAGSTIIACLYKRNCLIYLTAVILVTIVMQLRRRQLWLLPLMLITSLLAIFSTSFTQKYYEAYAGNVCGKGVPAISYLAMGLQYNGEEAIPGGWNGFHSYTYITTGYNRDETVRKSLDSIHSSLQSFQTSPSFALHFFHNKVLKQWANQTHGIYWGVNNDFDVHREQDAFWVRYLTSFRYQKTAVWEDFQESAVYGILLVYAFSTLYEKIKRHKLCLCSIVPAVTFIGGFLFSLLWEGQTSAVMYYPVFALPTAIGFLNIPVRQTEEVQAKD